jgi:hypothetical protein
MRFRMSDMRLHTLWPTRPSGTFSLMKTEARMDAMKGSSSADVVREFFAAFGRGDVEGVIGTFHPDAPPPGVPYGGVFVRRAFQQPWMKSK